MKALFTILKEIDWNKEIEGTSDLLTNLILSTCGLLMLAIILSMIKGVV